ncbi:condensation domain-containing protein, partial [Microbulbifer sp. TYP-18]|uniref:condensation domain-containing protein n=1 Tax=Microbulbifer sp. TYP-18 TaxID=3230024 RepID=UPI0034C6D795
MDIHAIVEQAAASGVYLYVEGDKLKYKAQQGGLPDTLRAQLKAHKTEVIAYLKSGDDKSAQGAMPAVTARGDNAPAPLSYAQRRLWLVDQVIGASALYNMPLAWRLRGRVDSAALLKSLNILTMRHGSLRTRFDRVGDEPVQYIDAAPAPPVFEVIDTTAQVEAQCRAERNHAFNLAGEGLCRIRVLRDREDSDRHGSDSLVLLVTMHHCVSDAWSLGIFIRELFACYSELCRTKAPPELAPLAFQYTDYASWQRQYLGPDVWREDLAYWKHQLRDLPAQLSLACDRPRSETPSYRGATISVVIDPSLTAQLQRLSQNSQASLYMTLLAAFSLLLSRHAGQDDICVGSPIANRDQPGTEALIGFFVNTLVLRTRFDDDCDVPTLLARTRETVLEAFDHQQLPFEALVDELSPTRTMNITPLFQAMFVMQNIPIEEEALPGVELTPMPVAPGEGMARFDLTLTVQQGLRGLDIDLEYSCDLFEADWAEGLLAHYQQLLAAMVATPERRLSQ